MWKAPFVSTVLAAGVASLLLLGENRVFPAGDIGWLYISLACFGTVLVFYGVDAAYHRVKRRKRKPVTGSTVDYATASVIANGYIDPDNTLRAGVRITVRSQILAKFEEVPGARVGDKYNADLLHRWFQKNAARVLVKHQSEIR